MAFLRLNVYSKALGMGTWVQVLIPNPPTMGDPNPLWQEKMKSLYLLHGLEGDETSWCRLTSLEKEARKLSMCVIMPACGRSFYTDLPNGQKYFTYITQELPEIMESLFPISSKGEDRFIAGMSMGGYGAIKAGLLLPNQYAACGSLSGVLDVRKCALPKQELEWETIFGNASNIPGSENDIIGLAEQMKPADLPRMYISCGTEDMLLPLSQNFYRTFQSKLPITYHESPGNHTWDYWEQQMPRLLDFLIK